MTKHTPGPWIYSRNSNPIHILGDWRGDGSYSDIAEIAPQEQPEALANARLIAAAPDMLAALRSLLNEADSVTIANGGTPGISDRWAAAKAARAAIAKATGA